MVDDTPEQIDTGIARRYETMMAVATKYNLVNDRLWEFVRFMQMGIDELREASQGAVGTDPLGSCAELFVRHDTLRTELEVARVRYMSAESYYRGWSRFFMVPGGHIHASLSCKTCNRLGRDTAFTWLPHLSGRTEAEAVAEFGPVLCTVCFPSAPLYW